MKFKSISITTLALLVTISLTGCAAVHAHHDVLFSPHEPTSGAMQSSDPVSGEWNVTFYVHEMKTPAKFNIKLDGAKVTGTAYSDHTGPGTIRDGRYADGKLSFTLDFAKHESIAVTGALKDGTLTGEFTTEGFTDKWEATKK